MKKILLASALFLFSLVFFLVPREVSAACLGLGELCGSPGDVCCPGLICTVTDPFSGVSTCETLSSPSPSSSPSPPVNLFCDDDKGIQTAIGCIPALDSQEAFLGWILKWAIGIGGGIAFLLIVYAGFLIMTSQGNPERLQAGKELLTSAISGLILLIFSIFILNVIGINILGIFK